MAASIVAMCLSSGAARASTVSVGQADSRGVVAFAGAPGERNDVSLRAVIGDGVGGSYWEIEDDGAALSPGAGCTALDTHTARCAGAESARVALGDLDDHLTASVVDPAALIVFPSIVVNGGAGNDTLRGADAGSNQLRGGDGGDVLLGGRFLPNVLHGGPGVDQLLGGDASDELDGGGGQDQLHGGGGDDRLSDGDRDGAPGDAAPGPDLLDGGAGRDEVSYEHRTQPIVVDLAHPGSDGEHGESDQIMSVESILGGHAADRLAGTRGRNTLDGLGGHDHLIGRAGRDLLRPGGDALSCGPGPDTVSRYGPFVTPPPRPADKQISARDFLGRDCELIQYSDEDSMFAYPAVTGPRHVDYRISCPEGDDGIELCSGTVVLRSADQPRRLLARGTFPAGFWRDRLVKAGLTPSGRALASRHHGVKAIVDVNGIAPLPIRWSIRLKI